MKTNPDKIRFITNIATALMLLLFIVYVIAEWKNIPDTVATHFGVSGEADGWGSKNSLVFIPAAAMVICTVLATVEYFPRFWNFPVEVTEENRERLFADGLLMTGVLKILIAAMFCYIGICTVKSMPVSWPMYVLLGVLAVTVTAGIVKMIKDM